MARTGKKGKPAVRGVRSIDFGDDFARIQDAAWVKRVTVSAFVRAASAKAADRVLARQREIAPEVAAA